MPPLIQCGGKRKNVPLRQLRSMPIRPEFRHFYGREWQKVIRPRILERAGNRCEECGVPNHVIATRAMSWWMEPPWQWWFKPWRPDQFPEIIWRSGAAIHKGDNFPREFCRQVYVVLTIAQSEQHARR